MVSYFCLSKYNNLFSITNKSNFFKKSFNILSRWALCVKNLLEYFYRKITRHANGQHAAPETRSAVITDLESQENTIILNIYSVNMKILKVTLKLHIYIIKSLRTKIPSVIQSTLKISKISQSIK